MDTSSPSTIMDSAAVEPSENNQDDDSNNGATPSPKSAETETAAAVETSIVQSHNNDDGDHNRSASPFSSSASCRLQFSALLRRHWMDKSRSFWTTILELTSPIFFMLALVAAYRASDVYTYPAASYAQWPVNLYNGTLASTLGPVLLPTLLASLTTANNNNNEGNTTGSGFPPFRELFREEYLSAARSQSPHPGWMFPNLPSPPHQWGQALSLALYQHVHQRVQRHLLPPPQQPNSKLPTRNLQEEEQSSDTTTTTTNTDSGTDVLTYLDQTYQSVQTDILQRPLPVPTLVEYLELSRYLRNLVWNYTRTSSNDSNSDQASIPSEIFESTSFAQQWGNVLTLGTIHLAPYSHPYVAPFVQYLQERSNHQQSSNNNNRLVWNILVHTDDAPPPTNNRSRTDDDDEEGWNTTITRLLVRIHPSQASALKYIDETGRSERTWAFLDFTHWKTTYNHNETANQKDDHDNHRKDEKETEEESYYSIRMNYTTLPNTNLMVAEISRGLNPGYQRYFLSGYLTMQRIVDEFAFSMASSSSSSLQNTSSTNTTNNFCTTKNMNETTLFTMPMPTVEYEQNTFYLNVGFLLGMTVTMSFLFPVAMLVKNIVEEKESKQREMMYIAGLRPWLHCLTWWFTAAITFAIVVLGVTWTLSGQILQYSSFGYLLALVGSFGLATIGVCWTVAAAFHQSKLAAIVGPMALFVTILPRFLFFQNNRHEYVTARKWASLLPSTAFCFGADIIADFEYNQVGIQSWNAGGEGYTFNTALGFLLLDALLYFTLGWYLEQVLPRPVGKPRKPYFLLTISYWRDCFCFQNSRWDKPRHPMESLADENRSSATNEDDSYHQVVDPSLKPRVQFRNVVKKYYRRRKDIPTAVNDLSLTLYEDQITALLGHNGAGKSSLIGMLTGMVQPTSGDCIVDGYSIVTDTAKARRSIGYCPQENIIFPKMTVREHIEFFMRIKGDRPTKAETTRRAREVGMEEFLNTRAGSLSGGNQRKLCLAMAFCGDPHNSVLILDEPTSGMDPASRRACWNCLFEKRRGRCIVLVSHFMSEADICGDRILIMKSGKLQASGSTMFLKNRFSLGYNLSVVINPPAIDVVLHENTIVADNSQEEANVSVSPLTFTIARNQLYSLLQCRIPNILMARSQGKEVTFRLPKGSEGEFPILFEDIDLHKDEFGIKAYGIENSSLEEVFLLLADDDHGDGSGIQGVHSGITSAYDEENLTCFREERSSTESCAVNGAFDAKRHQHEYPSWFQQIKLMFWKRYVVQRRDLKGAFFTILAPVLAIGLVLLILTVNLDVSRPPLQMSPEEYGRSEIVVGGGASSMNQSQTAPDVSVQIGQIKTALAKEYSQLSYRQVNASSSDEMSNYLMTTYNDRSHAGRFGAFVIEDLINATINIDWNYVQSNPSMIAALEDATGLAADPNDPSGFVNQIQLLFEIYLTSEGGEVVSQSSTRNASYGLNISSDISVLHNSSSPHAIAIFHQSFYDAMYASCYGKTMVKSVNHPLPLTTVQTLEVKVSISILATLFVLIPLCYIPGAFVVFLVRESGTCKHVQLKSGLDLTAYWIGNYLWDVSLFAIITVLIGLVLLMYGSDTAEVFVGTVDRFFCTLVLLFGYGLSILPFSYLIARRFRVHSTAQIAVTAVVFVTGFGMTDAIFIMESMRKTKHLAMILSKIFRVFPAFNLGNGLIKLSFLVSWTEVWGESLRPFDWDVTGFQICLLYLQWIPYFALVLFMDGAGSSGRIGTFRRLLSEKWERFNLGRYGVKEVSGELVLDDGHEGKEFVLDDDVAIETEIINRDFEELRSTVPMLFKEVWKIYLPPNNGLMGWISSALRLNKNSIPPKRAVRGVTTAVHLDETFVLLGKNGCGKSTSIGMLTGDILPTKGYVYVAGKNVSQVDSDSGTVGFCPQTDPLIESLTGRETLRLFARIRGIPSQLIDAEVDQLLDFLTLTSHADKATETYSGGNKRKLSLGIAMIGDPKVLIIDEPTCGVDPSSQRKIWNLVAAFAIGRSVLLTTHSMEEAQALSTRTAIMADGKLLCLGSIQHLKSKYLDAYTVDIFLPASLTTKDAESVVKNVTERTFESSRLVERHNRFLRFEISGVASSEGLGEVFRKLETLKSNAHVEEYSVKQCDLEQVFLKLISHSKLTPN